MVYSKPELENSEITEELSDLLILVAEIRIFFHSNFSSNIFGIRASSVMGTNKERLDRMEMELQEMRQVMQRSVIETGETRVLINGMEGRLKEVLDALSGLRLTQEKPQLNQGELASSSLQGMATREEGTHPHNRFFKMDFPRFSGDDPTEWLSRVEQYFEFQDTTEERRVSLASFHLEGEANQWWQWLKRVY